MITLFRLIRIWQLKVKWKLTLWQVADKLATDLIKNPEELEKKIVHELSELIHNTNENNTLKTSE